MTTSLTRAQADALRPTLPEHMTRSDAAELADVTTRTIDRWRWDGALATVQRHVPAPHARTGRTVQRPRVLIVRDSLLDLLTLTSAPVERNIEDATASL